MGRVLATWASMRFDYWVIVFKYSVSEASKWFIVCGNLVILKHFSCSAMMSLAITTYFMIALYEGISITGKNGRYQRNWWELWEEYNVWRRSCWFNVGLGRLFAFFRCWDRSSMFLWTCFHAPFSYSRVRFRVTYCTTRLTQRASSVNRVI